MTGFLSPTHLMLLVVVLLLVFGAKRLPELSRSLGSSLREFKHSLADEPTTHPALIPAPEPQTTDSPMLASRPEGQSLEPPAA